MTDDARVHVFSAESRRCSFNASSVRALWSYPMTNSMDRERIAALMQKLRAAQGGIEQWCSSSRGQAFNAVYREWSDCRPEKCVRLIQSVTDELEALLFSVSEKPANRLTPDEITLYGR